MACTHSDDLRMLMIACWRLFCFCCVEFFCGQEPGLTFISDLRQSLYLPWHRGAVWAPEQQDGGVDQSTLGRVAGVSHDPRYTSQRSPLSLHLLRVKTSQQKGTTRGEGVLDLLSKCCLFRADGDCLLCCYVEVCIFGLVHQWGHPHFLCLLKCLCRFLCFLSPTPLFPPEKQKNKTMKGFR